MITDELIFEKIVDFCIEQTGITKDEFKQKTRRKPVPYTRQMITWLATQETDFSQVKLANLIGYGGHSKCVRYARNKMLFYLQTDGKVQEDLRVVNEKLRNELKPAA